MWSEDQLEPLLSYVRKRAPKHPVDRLAGGDPLAPKTVRHAKPRPSAGGGRPRRRAPKGAGPPDAGEAGEDLPLVGDALPDHSGDDPDLPGVGEEMDMAEGDVRSEVGSEESVDANSDGGPGDLLVTVI